MQENYSQLGDITQAQKVISILQIDPKHRSLEDIELITNQVEENKFLSQFKGTQKLAEICKYMSIEFFKERQNVVVEGAMGDKFYIIHTGGVTVFKGVQSEIGTIILRRVVDLTPGDSFGELALQQDAPRAATVIAASDSWLITLNKEAYQGIIQNVQQHKIEGIKEFFQNLPLFHYVSKDNLTRIAEKCHFKKYAANTLILRQEDLPTSIFFIKSGRFKILRKVDFIIPETSSDMSNIAKLIRDPSLEDYENSKVESKLLEIDQLTSGDFFGEQSTILKEPIKYSVISAISAEVFTVDVSDFIKLGREFAEAFLRFSKMTPQDKDLRRALIEMSRWNFYKEGLTKSVKAQQINKQKDFDKQLRQPQQIPMKTQDTNERGIDGKFLENRSINQIDGDLVKPNFLSTFDYLVYEKKKKQQEIQKKQGNKNYLSGFD